MLPWFSINWQFKFWFACEVLKYWNNSKQNYNFSHFALNNPYAYLYLFKYISLLLFAYSRVSFRLQIIHLNYYGKRTHPETVNFMQSGLIELNCDKRSVDKLNKPTPSLNIAYIHDKGQKRLGHHWYHFCIAFITIEYFKFDTSLENGDLRTSKSTTGRNLIRV